MQKLLCREDGLAIASNGAAEIPQRFALTVHEKQLKTPSTWSKPRLVFVNSMSDLFHEDIPLAFIKKVFDTMKKCRKHTFQILTKRHKRLAEVAPLLNWPDNVWLGVTVESRDTVERIQYLTQTPATIKFLSCEPLLEDLPELPLARIDWVIVGGESGPGVRPMSATWVENIRLQCQQHQVAFYFKQWGGWRKNGGKPKLNGTVYQEYPVKETQLVLDLP